MSMTDTLAVPFHHRLAEIAARAMPRWSRRRPIDPSEAAEAARERRAFIQDMMHRNPDAFASDLDVQAMMGHFPSQF